MLIIPEIIQLTAAKTVIIRHVVDISKTKQNANNASTLNSIHINVVISLIFFFFPTFILLFLSEHPTETENTNCHKDMGKTKAEIKHRLVTHT